MKLEKIRFLANFGLKKDLDGLPETTLQCSQHKKVVFNVSRLVLLRRQKRRLVQAPQTPFRAPAHSKCCIGGFRETGLALVIVLRCD